MSCVSLTQRVAQNVNIAMELAELGKTLSNVAQRFCRLMRCFFRRVHVEVYHSFGIRHDEETEYFHPWEKNVTNILDNKKNANNRKCNSRKNPEIFSKYRFYFVQNCHGSTAMDSFGEAHIQLT